MSLLRNQLKQSQVLFNVTVELTYGCDLNCFYCYNDQQKKGVPLRLGQYHLFFDDLVRMGTMTLMLTGGEPMLHPRFFDLAGRVNELGFVITVRTNGNSLTSENCQRLRAEVNPYRVEVTLHGATAEVHDRQTRVSGSFDRLLAHLRIAADNGLRLSAVCTPTAWNQHQIAEMFSLCDDLGVPLRFQGPVAPRANGDFAPLALQPSPQVWPEIEEHHRKCQPLQEHGVLDQTAESPTIEATCNVGTIGAHIDPFGNVLACMHLGESAGSLHQHSIVEIWESAPLFAKARERAHQAAESFRHKGLKQFGAPLYCLGVEESFQLGLLKGTR